MSDFYQHGGIATIHHLGNPNYKILEEELNALTPAMALVLPCHARDLETPAMAGILRELQETRFLKDIVVGLDGADANGFALAQSLFGSLSQRVSILWNDGPRLQCLINDLEHAGLRPGGMGKGRNMRLCFGQVLAGTTTQAIAVHDCDIVDYRREILVRLSYPVAHPEMGYHVSKGFSARFSDRLNGRVMRLLIAPLLRAMEELDGFGESLALLQNFRYPISGEVCLHRKILHGIRFPSDWGVEAGMMSDVFRICDRSRVCQVDIAESYDHKHQELSESDPLRGLNKMTTDVALCLLRSATDYKKIHSANDLVSVVNRYLKIAPEFINCYEADARMNLLKFDRALERQTVELFADSIRRAIALHLSDPLQPAGAPCWNEIEFRLPGFSQSLSEAVELDNAGPNS